MNSPLKTHFQADAYASPWSLRQRLVSLAWSCTWSLTCAWTPKPFNPWRLLVLRAFGTRIHGTPFVHQRARIQQPHNLVLHHRACLGDGAMAYSLDRIELHEGATIAQEAYLCTGTHDFALPNLPLQTAPIVVGRGAFVGARAFVLPGCTLGANCIVGAMSVVTRDVPAGAVVAGNPARSIVKTGGGGVFILKETPMPGSADNGPCGA
jgi:putative colanic acid biosynthesis acetyltransferase WcaF